MKIKNILLLIFLTCGIINDTNALENKIVFKINNSIITSLDIKKETRYLLALSPEMKDLGSDKIYNISKKSVIREKIKNAEVIKNFDKLSLDEKALDPFIKNTYENLGINSKNDFANYLKKKNLSLDDINRKITFEMAWNRLVYFKYFSKVKINENDLKKKILSEKNKGMKMFFLQEILFEVEKNSKLKTKYDLIKENIQKEGFEKSALLFSVSDSSKTGGDIGWVNINALNPNIVKKISNIQNGNYTDPIVVPGGFLILKIKDTKIVNKEINVDEELSKIIRIKTNQQLNQFSLIYYNKLKSNAVINEF